MGLQTTGRSGKVDPHWHAMFFRGPDLSQRFDPDRMYLPFCSWRFSILLRLCNASMLIKGCLMMDQEAHESYWLQREVFPKRDEFPAFIQTGANLAPDS